MTQVGKLLRANKNKGQLGWAAAIVLSLSILGGPFAHAQIKPYVLSHAIGMHSIHPRDTAWDDLEKIGQAIGEADLVLLGEQDHGDAPAFLAKTRLVRYLHEEKGFNVLAFESDFFSLHYGWERTPKDRDSLVKFLAGNVYGVWSQCDACAYLLYDYLPSTYQTTQPLRVTGFDNQLVLAYATEHLASVMDSVMRHYQLPIVQTFTYETEVVPAFQRCYAAAQNPAICRKNMGLLTRVRAELAQVNGADGFWALTVENLLQAYRQYGLYKKDFVGRSNTRDRQMALNVAWLKRERFPREKMIIWAQNGHIAKHAGHYSTPFMNEFQSMGSVLERDSTLAKSMYVLGFTSYTGTTARVGRQPYLLEKPQRESVEQWLESLGHDYAFVDFRPYN